MFDFTYDSFIIIAQSLWNQANEMILEFNTTEYAQIIYHKLNTVTHNPDFSALIILFAFLYILYCVLKMIFRWIYGTVIGVIKFAFYITICIFLYWLYVSIDVEKGNEQLLLTKDKIVSGVQNVVGKEGAEFYQQQYYQQRPL
nr:3892_t:CDS:1 [Entrophospora candida]